MKYTPINHQFLVLDKGEHRTMTKHESTFSPLVSVIIPTYNRQNSILKALNSVLNQTYKNLEVIIIDDGSTDDTVKIINDLNDHRVKIYQNDSNRGACYSRNRGVNLSNGDIVAFEDSDDVWHGDKLEKCIHYMMDYDYEVVFSAFTFGDNNKVPDYDITKIDNKFKKVFLNPCLTTSTLVIKRNIILLELFDERLPRMQDFDLSLRLVQNYKVGYIDEILVDLYVSDNSISRSFSKALKAQEILYEKYKDEIDSDNEICGIYHLTKGKYSEMCGFNGVHDFEIAKNLLCNKSTVSSWLLAKLRLYRPIYKFYSHLTSVYFK